MKPHRKLVEDATLIETMQAAAALVGHELPAEFAAMTSAPRDDRLAREAPRWPSCAAPAWPPSTTRPA